MNGVKNLDFLLNASPKLAVGKIHQVSRYEKKPFMNRIYEINNESRKKKSEANLKPLQIPIQHISWKMKMEREKEIRSEIEIWQKWMNKWVKKETEKKQNALHEAYQKLDEWIQFLEKVPLPIKVFQKLKEQAETLKEELQKLKENGLPENPPEAFRRVMMDIKTYMDALPNENLSHRELEALKKSFQGLLNSVLEAKKTEKDVEIQVKTISFEDEAGKKTEKMVLKMAETENVEQREKHGNEQKVKNEIVRETLNLGKKLEPTSTVSMTRTEDENQVEKKQLIFLKKEFAEKIEAFRRLSADKNRIYIQLKPEKLGKVELLFKKTKNGNIEITVEAESKQARDIVESLLESIKKELKEKAVELNFVFKENRKNSEKREKRKVYQVTEVDEENGKEFANLFETGKRGEISER